MQAAKDVVRGIYDAFAKGDLAGATQAFHEQIVWDYPGKPPYAEAAPYKGKQSIINNVFQKLAAEWDNFVVDPQVFIAEGSKVAVVCKETGKAKGTGKEISVEAVHVWTIENGRVTAMSAYTDTLQFSRAVGLV